MELLVRLAARLLRIELGGKIDKIIAAVVIEFSFRKGSYLTCAVLFIIGSLSFQFCRAFSSVELLILGRMCVGLASGITTTCLPMYLSEIAPLHLRGTLGVFCSMGITGGVVVGQIVSLQEVFGTADLWHFAMSFQLVFLIICTLPYRWFPESPKYLYLINDRSGAMRELRKLCTSQDMVQEEFDGMQPGLATGEKRGVLSVLRDPKLLLPMVLVCAMQGGQQLSGINAVSLSMLTTPGAFLIYIYPQVFYYSVSIFVSAGFSTTNAMWANLSAGVLNLIVSFFSPWLMANVNRRPLMLISCSGCAVFLTLLGLFIGLAVSRKLPLSLY